MKPFRRWLKVRFFKFQLNITIGGMEKGARTMIQAKNTGVKTDRLEQEDCRSDSYFLQMKKPGYRHSKKQFCRGWIF